MKPSSVFGFILGVFVLLGLGALVFPSDGIDVGSLNLRFSSLERAMAPSGPEFDVDGVIGAAEEGFTVGNDTLSFYRRFFSENPNRIYLPGDDYTFFDPVFRSWESARKTGTTWRVAHYGDSQIEMDRISADLRDALQERFGGEGTGMFPVLSNVPSASIMKSASGAMVHYTMYGDSTTVRASHRRYGVMAQLTELSGSGTVSLRATTSKKAYPRTRSFSRISVLLGRNRKGCTLRLVSDTVRPEPAVLGRDTLGGWLVSWDLPESVSKARISISGDAEIYGVMADGKGGVAVDNIPLRGSSGTIFHRIDPKVMSRGFSLDRTNLIMLQFGGNMMPSIRGGDQISEYMRRIETELRYFKEVAPGARILFIGPSDMGKSVRGKVVTWPHLPELVDSLKSTALASGAAFWDLYGVMGGENSMARWVKHSPPLAGADYIHFTPQGATLVGETLSRSLLVYHDFYRLRGELGEERVRKAMGR